MSKIYLMTYGSGKYDNAKYRLKQEALDFDVFNSIIIKKTIWSLFNKY